MRKKKLQRQQNKIKMNRLIKKNKIIVKKLMKKTIKETIESCSICYDEQKKTNIVTFNCGHSFCLDCVISFFNKDNYNYSTMITLDNKNLILNFRHLDVNYNNDNLENIIPSCFMCKQDVKSLNIQLSEDININSIIELKKINENIDLLTRDVIYYETISETYASKKNNENIFFSMNKKYNKLYNKNIKKKIIFDNWLFYSNSIMARCSFNIFISYFII